MVVGGGQGRRRTVVVAANRAIHFADDVLRVANTYFAEDQRNVLIINQKETGDGEPPMDPQMAQMMQMVKSIDDPARLEQMIGMVTMQMDKIEDPAEKASVEKLLEAAREQLKTLKASAEKK